ncbi:hypothetical protein BJY16_006821 [Actinoplanes octamycinicus]|uniref:Uncharacterized protein n=1 Tax=Actinoplanes octamycinicus TaxID=135948 RepID=A0A7W7H474_9ACTN|nr:hypothetical protein [Actinoplanes octamycinicus]MBB4743362.1 hypothetical protein [Actinoplanes octamycinicus]
MSEGVAPAGEGGARMSEGVPMGEGTTTDDGIAPKSEGGIR